MSEHKSAAYKTDEPVLLLCDSAGFPFGLDHDPTVLIRNVADLRTQIPLGMPTVIASLDAATAVSLRHEPLSSATALVIIDDWGSQDPSLQPFALLFVRDRLRTAGIEAPVFVVTTAAASATHWPAGLTVMRRSLPLPALLPTTRKADAPRSVGVLLDTAPDSVGELVAFATSLQTRTGAQVRFLPPPEGCVPDVPETSHLVDLPGRRLGWLMPRLDVLIGKGFDGWKRRFAVAARQSGVQTIDVSGMQGRTAVTQALGNGADVRTAVAQPAESFGAWCRECLSDADVALQPSGGGS